MKLVKKISTNEYKLIEDSVFSANTSMYINRSDNPVYWYDNYEKIGISYFKMRNLLNNIVISKVNGFNDFRNDAKDVLGKLIIGNQNDMIMHYIVNSGQTLAQAQQTHIDRLSLNVVKKSESTRIIASSSKIITVGIKYLTWVESGTTNADQANNFTSAIQGFLTEYERYAILGLNYGDEKEGIMDYIESTNNYASGGLKNYIFNPSVVTAYSGDTNAVRLAMASELNDIFVNGNI